MANDEAGSLLQRYLLLVQALCDAKLTKGDCQVLAVIGGHVGKDGEAWPGVNRIAGKAGIHRSTVMRAVDRLEAAGYVDVQRKRGLSNRYQMALASSVRATSASSANATSAGAALVASTHTTSSADATGPVASTRPDQSHPCDPNSAFELSCSNSKKRTQLPAAPSSSNERQERSAEEKAEDEATEIRITERARIMYLDAIKSGDDRTKAMIETNHRHRIADLIGQEAA